MKKRFLLTGSICAKNGKYYVTGLVYNDRYNKWGGNYNSAKQSESSYLYEVDKTTFEKVSALLKDSKSAYVFDCEFGLSEFGYPCIVKVLF